MTLLFTATQTQLYRTKDFHGLKFAANLQHALFFSNFLGEQEADVERARPSPSPMSRAETC